MQDFIEIQGAREHNLKNIDNHRLVRFGEVHSGI